jgi:hypothetical protein
MKIEELIQVKNVVPSVQIMVKSWKLIIPKYELNDVISITVLP